MRDLDARVVRYGRVESPVGRIWVAASRKGLVRIAFGGNERAFVAELHRSTGTVPLRSNAAVGPFARHLAGYFAGKPRRQPPPVHLIGLTPFQRRVLEEASAIPAGEAISYGELARRIGKPRAARAVGQALGRNPIPIVIPCHRVVAADRTLGGYTGGLRIKRKLLAIDEAAAGMTAPSVG